MHTYHTYLSTELRRALRSRRLLLLTAAYPAVMYLVLSGAFDDGTVESGLTIAPYMMVSMALFGSTGAALAVSGVISAEREAGWTRQLRLTPLPGWAYVLGKLFVALVSAVAAIATVFVVARFVGAGGIPWSHFVAAAVVLLVGTPPFAALGILFGYLAVGQAGRPLMMFTWMGLSLFGGLWIPVNVLPSAMRSIAEVTPTYQLAEAAREALVGHAPSLDAAAVLLAWTVIIGAVAAWRYRADTVRAVAALA